MTIDELEQEVLKLSAEERARLAERIISSLDSEAEIEREWLAEVRGRAAGVDSCDVGGSPREDALTSIRSRVGWEKSSSTLPNWQS